MKHLLFILSFMLLTITSYSQFENRIKPDRNIETAPGANYILLSDVNGEYQAVPSNTLPGGGSGDIIQTITYGGDTLIVTTDQAVFQVNINAGTVETTAPISINGNVYPAGTDIQTILGDVGVAINNISLVDNGDGTYTFTDTDGTAITINTGLNEGSSFYKLVAFNESYSLPIDTLDKYDIITISVQTGSEVIDQTITLPDITGGDNNGKIIILNFDSGSEILDTVIVQATGPSKIIQSNCYQTGRTEQPDTFAVSYDNPITVIYHTSYLTDDYYRQCEGLVTLSDGTVILPGDTIPVDVYHTVPYMLARQQLYRLNSSPVTDYQGSLSNALDAKIVETNGEFRMYFLGYKSYEPGIDSASYYYQVSTDVGRTWELNDTIPFFTPSKDTAELDLQLWEFYILQEDATNWKMYYQGAKPDPNFSNTEIYRTFLATSSDGGNTWTRQGLVLDAGADRANDWDGTYAGVRSVVKYKDKYILCYEGRNSVNEMAMGIAISDDGITFSKVNGDGLVMEMEPGTYSWETNAMLPYVQVVDSVLVAMYGNNIAASPSADGDNRKAGLAYSVDGINWTKYKGNPIIDFSLYPNEHNENNNAFISFYEYDPGSFMIITREKGPNPDHNFWDNGLYHFGNNLVLANRAEVTYISNLSGNDNLGQIGNPNQPFSSVRSGGNNKRFFEGEHVFTGPYSSAVSATRLTNDGDNYIFAKGATIRYEGATTGSTTPMFSDNTSSFGNTATQHVVFEGGNIEVEGTGLKIPIGYYNAETSISFDVDTISAKADRGWGIQCGAPYVDIKADYLEYGGDIAISQYTSYPAGQNKHAEWDIDIGKIKRLDYVRNGGGLIRLIFDANLNDSLSNSTFDLDIEEVDFTEGYRTDHYFNLKGYPAGQNNLITLDIDKIYEDTSKAVTANLYGMFALGVNQQYNSKIDINMGFIGATSRPLFARGNVSFANCFMTNSRLAINIGKATWTDIAPTTDNINYQFDSSTMIINCEDCRVYGSNPLLLMDGHFSFAQDSDFILSGSYTSATTEILRITSVPGFRVILKDFYGKNDSGSPIITSTVPITIYVTGAFDLGNSAVDPGITFIRLNEIGSNSENYSISGSTNINGDITVPHTLGSASINVNVTPLGTVLRRFTAHDKTSSDFKVRFYDSAGTPLGAGTSIDFDVQIKKQ